MLLFIDWFISVPLIKIFSTVLKSISLCALFRLSGSSFSFLSFAWNVLKSFVLSMYWNVVHAHSLCHFIKLTFCSLCVSFELSSAVLGGKALRCVVLLKRTLLPRVWNGPYRSSSFAFSVDNYQSLQAYHRTFFIRAELLAYSCSKRKYSQTRHPSVK